MNDFSVNIEYKVVSERSEDKTVEPAKDEYDLNDLEENDKSEQSENSIRVEKISKFQLPLANSVKSPGKYHIFLTAEFTNSSASKNNDSEAKFVLNYSFGITAISKVKLNHLKIALTDTQSNADDKEVTIEYPKRSFKNFKATQNSVIKLKIKMNYGDTQFFKIEQVFLKLRHVEYGKTYSSYATHYNNEDQYYNIEFDLSDTVIDKK